MASRTADLNHALRSAGFVLRRQRKHLIWDCPCGHAQITTSGSKQTGSGDTWTYSLMRRTLRICRQNMITRRVA